MGDGVSDARFPLPPGLKQLVTTPHISVNLPTIPIQRQNLQRSLLQLGIQGPQPVQLEWPVAGVIKAKQESPDMPGLAASTMSLSLIHI